MAPGFSSQNALLFGLWVAACGRPGSPRALPPPRIAPAILAPQPPICRFSLPAESSVAIAIAPRGRLPRFEVIAMDATMSPARDGGWEADVGGPLAFRGVVDEPALVTARAVDDGAVVHLEPGRSVDSLRLARAPGGLVGRAFLVSRSDEPTRLELTVSDVPFACADLRVARADDDGARDLRAADIWSPVRMADGGALDVRDAPGGRVRATVRGEGLFVHVLEHSDEAARVVLQWSDGSLVRGWVDAAALREPEPEERLRIGRAMGGLAELDVTGFAPLSTWVPGMGLGLGRMGEGRGPWGGLRPRERVPESPSVSARLAEGTRVYAAPGEGAWATVAGDGVFRVAAHPSCAWVAIERAPGLVVPPLRAWVRAGALRIAP